MSSRPADRQQTYGYGKFENLSALFQTLLLLVTCTWIVYEASRRLFFGSSVEVTPSVWAFLVVILVDRRRLFPLAGLAAGVEEVPEPGP